MAYRPEIVGLVSERESEERARGVQHFIENASAEYAKEGIPIRPDGRIDMEAFKDVYPADLERDGQGIQRWFDEWYKDIPEVERDSQRLASDGEKLEMLTHAVLYKNLGKRFVVVRSSYYDDIHNKIDNGLFDRETGDPICTFDEVGDTKGRIFEDKQAAVRDRNVAKGGGTMKYGLKLENTDSGKKFVPGIVRNVPLFYIALPKDRIEKGIKEFVPSQTEQSEFEKKLFEYFLQAIAFQIQGLELYGGRLDENLKKRLGAFKKTIEEVRGGKSKFGL